MLLPIGQENATVRRQPWVSYGLIAFNVLVFLVMAVAFDEDTYMRQLGAKGGDIEEYLAQHPYLDPPEDLARYLDEELLEQLRTAKQQYQAEGAMPPPQTIESEQSRLQALVGELLAIRNRLPYRRLGFIPARGGVVTALTSMFVHAGLFHLLGNMLFFFLSGPFVEDVFGRPLFAALYLLSGCAGTAIHALRFSASDIPTVGASGAIAGVMGAFLVRLGASRIQFLYMPFFPFFWRVRFTFFMPAFVVLPLWFGEQVWYAHASSGESGIGWWAHIGGFLFGAAAAGSIRLLAVEERFIHPAIEKQISLVQHPALEAALEARTRGDWETAREEVGKVLAAEPGNIDAWIESYEIALGARDLAEAGKSAARLLELHAKHGERDLALHLIRDAQERGGEGLAPRFHMAAGAFLEKDGDARSALELYERVVREAPADPAALRALFRRGEILAKGGDVKGAREAFDRARRHPGWNEQMKEAVNRTLAAAEGKRPA